MEDIDQDEEPETPFRAGNYVLMVREPDEDNVFGVIIKKVARHQFIVKIPDGDEFVCQDCILLHAEPGDTSWLIYLIPVGACIVNINPTDELYTSDSNRLVDFDVVARKVHAALSEKFIDTPFKVTPIGSNDEQGLFSIHNNSTIKDARIASIVSDVLAKAPFSDDIWIIDDPSDDDEADDEESYDDDDDESPPDDDSLDEELDDLEDE